MVPSAAEGFGAGALQTGMVTRLADSRAAAIERETCIQGSLSDVESILPYLACRQSVRGGNHGLAECRILPSGIAALLDRLHLLYI